MTRVTGPWPVGVRAWADAVAARYRHRPGRPAPVGTVLLRPSMSDTSAWVATYRTELRVAPRLELTVAVHRRVESELVQRLLTRVERREPRPSHGPVGPPPSTTDTAVGPGGRPPEHPAADPPAPPARRPDPPDRFEPVPRIMRMPPAPPPAVAHPAAAGAPATRIPASGPVPAMGRPTAPPPGPWPVDLDRLTDRVVQAIDRRVTARRERQGRT